MLGFLYGVTRLKYNLYGCVITGVPALVAIISTWRKYGAVSNKDAVLQDYEINIVIGCLFVLVSMSVSYLTTFFTQRNETTGLGRSIVRGPIKVVSGIVGFCVAFCFCSAVPLLVIVELGPQVSSGLIKMDIESLVHWHLIVAACATVVFVSIAEIWLARNIAKRLEFIEAEKALKEVIR